jgi:light-regulated signal transduction histidine kinase (bacteriophytochrome)
MANSLPSRRSQRKKRTFALGVAAVAAVGIADYLTGIELSLEVFYVAPVSYVAWRAGLWPGLLLAAGAALTWLAADQAAGHRYALAQAPYWNALGGFLVFALLAAVTARTRALAAEGEASRRALARKTRELERSNAELEQYAAAAAHDLKSPLVAVGGYLQLLRRKLGSACDPSCAAYLDQAVRGTERMEALIDDLLAYARVGKGERAPELADANAALDEALANLAAEVEASGARISRDRLPAVPVSYRELVQLFQNLVGNALKFRGEAPPQVHVGVQEGPDEWVFSVRDNGIGIDPAHADKVFGLFERLHGPAEYPGTGLGLALCKKVVESRGGRIWVESQPGQGATFSFTVPRTEGV